MGIPRTLRTPLNSPYTPNSPNSPTELNTSNLSGFKKIDLTAYAMLEEVKNRTNRNARIAQGVI